MAVPLPLCLARSLPMAVPRCLTLSLPGGLPPAWAWPFWND